MNENNKQILVAEVKCQPVESGAITSHVQFFETNMANNAFYQKIAKHLLLMHTVGSISIEQRVKPINHTILIKKRSCLQDPKGVALFRVLKNLKHIMKSKIALSKMITDSYQV